MGPPKFNNHLDASYQEALEQTRLALAEIQALYHVTHSLIAFSDLPSLLQTVVDSVARALSANRVTLITFDLETHHVTHFMKGGPGVKYVVEVSFEELWEGLSGWALRETKPALSPKDVPDIRESLEVRRRRLETDCGSIIVVPLYYLSHILGTMTAINCPDEREFTERDVNLMMAMASQCAISIENARLFEQLQSTNSELEQRIAERTAELTETNVQLQAEIAEHKRSEEALRKSEEDARAFQEKLKALQKISLDLAAIESLEQLCRRAIELGLSSLGYDRIGLLLFENTDKSKVSRFGFESTGELRIEQGMSYNPATDRVYSQLHNRENAFVSEDADLEDFENVVGRGWNVVVGLWDANASIGWLTADNFFSKQPLIPYQIELLKLYGLTLGHLVTRKRAEESLRRYNQRLSILHDIDRSILVASSLESIADIVLKHLAQLIPCEFASVILHNDELTEEQVFAWNHAPDVHVLTRTIQPVVPNQVLERLKSGQSAVTADLRTQGGQLALLAEDLVNQGVYSAMANPMMVQGRLIGTLAFASRQIGFFTSEHRQIGEEVADQVAIAFHQAKLYDQIERHNLELEQRVRERTTQLENANCELELFSYSVSHDLRAPLRAIQGFAEIIARRYKGNLNEEGRHYFDNIVTASEQMNQLITDLLDYVRLGRQHVRLTSIQLGKVISEVVKNLMPQIEESSAQIHVEDLPDVLGDSTLLNRIFTNLLENALVYHRPNIPPIISIGYVLEADYTIIHVSDNGIGIPPEFRDKIFDIFQRLHTQDKYPGTGIGLAIVRKSVEILKGTVWVDAAGDMGSIFCVKLPHKTEKGK